jgi:hypothetical protein
LRSGRKSAGEEINNDISRQFELALAELTMRGLQVEQADKIATDWDLRNCNPAVAIELAMPWRWP